MERVHSSSFPLQHAPTAAATKQTVFFNTTSTCCVSAGFFKGGCGLPKVTLNKLLGVF
jgi:hypothetical protein